MRQSQPYLTHQVQYFGPAERHLEFGEFNALHRPSSSDLHTSETRKFCLWRQTAYGRAASDARETNISRCPIPYDYPIQIVTASSSALHRPFPTCTSPQHPHPSHQNSIAQLRSLTASPTVSTLPTSSPPGTPASSNSPLSSFSPTSSPTPSCPCPCTPLHVAARRFFSRRR